MLKDHIVIASEAPLDMLGAATACRENCGEQLLMATPMLNWLTTEGKRLQQL
jgi:hypothetical protein